MSVGRQYRFVPRTTVHAVLFATGVAVVTCLTRLGSQPLSWDEAVTVNAGRRSWTALWTLLGHTDAPLGAYYAVMHVWIDGVGLVGIRADEFWLRLPSAVAGVGTVALTALLAARAYGPVLGATSGSLLALHPLFVFYAHDARPYAFVTLLTTAATVVMLRILRTPDARYLAGYAALAMLALSMQVLGAALVLAVHAGVAAVRGSRRVLLLTAICAPLAAAVPLVLVSRRQAAEVAWISGLSPSSVGSFLVRVVGGGTAAPVICVVLALGVRAAIRRQSVGVEYAALVGCAVVPIVGVIGLSVWQPLLVPRYVLVALPALVVVVVSALGGVRVWPRIAGALLAAIALANAGGTIVQDAQTYKYEDFRAAASLIQGSAHTGDGVVFLPPSYRVGMEPYLGNADTDRGLPSDVALSGAFSPYTSAVIGGSEVNAASIDARIDAEQRIFVIGSGPVPPLHTARGAAVPDVAVAKEVALTRNYSLVWIRRFGDVTVSLFRRERPAA
jgi:mannosyltransferase